MGKYLKKAKPKGELALLDSTTATSSYFGVRTRAKTLALQKSQSPSPELSSGGAAGGSYLQLRSRRLHKPPISIPSHDSSKRQRHQNPKSPIPNRRSGARLGVGSVGSEEGRRSREVEGNEEKEVVHENANGGDGEEACFGENFLEFEGRERSTRETTPCSLIRDPDTVRTPGSTTRPTCSTEAHRRTEIAARRQIPTGHEMNEFFSEIEEAQQRQFIQKYNFDPVNEKPLPGRFEWEKVEPEKVAGSVPSRHL